MWNVSGIMKGEEVVDLFRKGKFELFALTETKLKGNVKVSWCGVNGIIAGVQDIKGARKGMAVLMNDVYHIGMSDFGYMLALESCGLSLSFQGRKREVLE